MIQISFSFMAYMNESNVNCVDGSNTFRVLYQNAKDIEGHLREIYDTVKCMEYTQRK